MNSGPTSLNSNNEEPKSPNKLSVSSWTAIVLFAWARGIIGLIRYSPPRFHTEQEKKFVPTPTKFPLFPEGLLAAIISYVPLERAQVILYKNGDIDPRIVMTEVELYHTNAQTKAFYIGVLKGDGSSIETFTDVTEGEKRVAELEAMKEGEIVVVNGFK
jgi:hypothetical protein